MIERSLAEIAKTKLNVIATKLPKAAKFKYLPITNQLLIYCASEEKFKRQVLEEIVKTLPDCEDSAAKTGYWRYTNFLVINNFADDCAEKKPPNDLLSLKILTAYAMQKEKNRIDSEINWEAHTAFYDSYGNIDYANKIGNALRKNSEVSHAGLVAQITDLKKSDKKDQRFLLYTQFNIFHDTLSFENAITASAVEYLLTQLPKIDEHKIPFSQLQNMKIDYPKDILLTPALIYQIKNPFMIFSNTNPLREEDYLNIAGLNLTINAFNEKYQGQYKIKKGEGIDWKGFWLVFDNKETECGVLMLEDNELKETPHSRGVNHCLETILEQEAVEPVKASIK